MRSGPVAAARARSLVPWRSSLRWRSAHSSTSVPFPRLLSLLVGVVPVKRDDGAERRHRGRERTRVGGEHDRDQDRKSTRLNSSHVAISYAVFCLKKKKTTGTTR